MIIEWSVSKKRGNHRPVLRYTVRLEEFERDLALPQVMVESEIPKPPEGWEGHCHPGRNERGGAPCGMYALFTPSHKEGECSASLRLPWREDGEYPEIERSFRRLREDFEAVLKSAYDSNPIDLSRSLGLSNATRRHIASGVAACRFLQAVGL